MVEGISDQYDMEYAIVVLHYSAIVRIDFDHWVLSRIHFQPMCLVPVSGSGYRAASVPVLQNYI